MMTAKSDTIDEYIAGFPEEIQEILQQIRNTIQKAAPEAKEAISYAMPTFKLNGNKKELSVYKGAKGSVQFPLDQPMPQNLITKIVKFRVKQSLKEKK